MKKKLIKVLVIMLIVASVFLIYQIFRNDKINYVCIGDSLAAGKNPYGEIGYGYSDFLADQLKDEKKLSTYTKKHAINTATSKDMLENIKNSSQLKRDLRESDLVTISIGIYDFSENLKRDSIDVNRLLELKSIVKIVMPNIEEFIKETRKYAKKDIIIVGYYNPIPFLFNTSGSDLDQLFGYIDDEYRRISEKYNVKYISMYQLFKNNNDFLPNPADIHPSLEGYKAMSKEIVKIL